MHQLKIKYVSFLFYIIWYSIFILNIDILHLITNIKIKVSSNKFKYPIKNKKKVTKYKLNINDYLFFIIYDYDLLFMIMIFDKKFLIHVA